VQNIPVGDIAAVPSCSGPIAKSAKNRHLPSRHPVEKKEVQSKNRAPSTSLRQPIPQWSRLQKKSHAQHRRRALRSLRAPMIIGDLDKHPTGQRSGTDGLQCNLNLGFVIENHVKCHLYTEPPPLLSPHKNHPLGRMLARPGSRTAMPGKQGRSLAACLTRRVYEVLPG
jgi:hypothetical protein